MNKKILLLGGTGAMGVYIVPLLLDKGFDVYVTSRKKRESKILNLKYIQVNAHEKSFLSEYIEGQQWDCIIDFMVYGTAEFESRFKTLLKNSGHYIFLSTYRVFANSKMITEGSPKLLNTIDDNVYLNTDEYALTKARQEEILVNSKYNNWTIVRPSITFSKNRFQMGTLEADSLLFRSNQNLPVIFPRELLEKETTMTWAGDVAKMITSLVLNSESYGEDYNVATAQHIKWKSILDIYKSFLELEVIETDIQTYLLAVGNEYQLKYDRMFDRKMDNSKILKISNLDQKELMDVKEGLIIELKNFMKTPIEYPINYALQGRIDKITRTNISLKEASLKDKVKYLVRKYF